MSGQGNYAALHAAVSPPTFGDVDGVGKPRFDGAFDKVGRLSRQGRFWFCLPGNLVRFVRIRDAGMLMM